eukprot:CAMPEP_0115350014 /NCGR_PEP_ID=MMETSP0270-20121206/96245_1 /TAXON_ID=71861 /ORGANISM="Scrippsiella trochoidea, Strain CCMP3099" /LENGTH=48 /DNA_ID= /DNA_START= /DNA_END= /DNA_ORIENTATION=
MFAARELKQAGYSLASGFLFESPQIGNASLAEVLNSAELKRLESDFVG